MVRFFIASMFMFISGQAVGAPIYGGTATFDFGVKGNTTVNWAVYAKGSTEISASASAQDFTYLYTIYGHSDAGAKLQSLTLAAIAPVTINSFGVDSGMTPEFTPSVAGSGVSSLKVTYMSGLGSNQSSSIYWVTPGAPAYASQSANLVLAKGATQYTASSRDLMVPGAPEPETWALIIVLSAFSLWWIRRESGDDTVIDNTGLAG